MESIVMSQSGSERSKFCASVRPRRTAKRRRAPARVLRCEVGERRIWRKKTQKMATVRMAPTAPKEKNC